jgi:hypothetical protein
MSRKFLLKRTELCRLVRQLTDCILNVYLLHWLTTCWRNIESYRNRYICKIWSKPKWHKYSNGNVYRSAKHAIMQTKVNITSTKLMPLKQLNCKRRKPLVKFQQNQSRGLQSSSSATLILDYTEDTKVHTPLGKWSKVQSFWQMHTVKVYEASSLPIFLVVTFAVPYWLKASNVGTLMFVIFPGLLMWKYNILDILLN